MVRWVWEKARGAKRLDGLVVATDDERILQAVRDFGCEAKMTPADLPSGTDRVWWVAKETPAKLVVNIQADEPMIEPDSIDRLVKVLQENPKAQMVTLRFPMRETQGYRDPHVVKVVTDQEGWALYFSRSPIPGSREDRTAPSVWYKHIGIYAYRREILQAFVGWPVSPLEKTEGLEQLRALEHGVKIQVIDSPQDTVGVDTTEDLKRVEHLLKGA